MSDIFSISRLSERPDLAKESFALIEQAFHYDQINQFNIDFWPIANSSNWHQFLVLHQHDKVISTSGYCIKNFGVGKFQVPICMLGAIATDQNYKGRGFASQLIEKILFINEDSAGLFLLWSDLCDLYAKFGFEQIGKQYVYRAHSEAKWLGPFKWSELTLNQQENIKLLHHNFIAKNFCTIIREPSDWHVMDHMTSVDIYISPLKDRYFVANKGQDLSNVIHEYAFDLSRKDIFDFPNNFEWWSPIQIPGHNQDRTLYACLAKCGHLNLIQNVLSGLSINKEHWRDLFTQLKYPFYISGIESI